ncbi:zinc finger protein 718-like isoform X1 [Homalodisca vitripennis]|uniref:zinc finger protein 718-like isoform X1 n=1 Tax=Homalodisca vitripennis TaxID=197043 RepID=UPI001EEAD0D2|nr:zinc finger protein 718-like isoform X1 [Homalodisca vitripennis]
MKQETQDCFAVKVAIFESTQVALNVEFLSLIPATIDLSSFFITLAEEMQLTFCEQIDNGCPVLLGLWSNVLKAEKRLEELLESWEEEKSTDPDQKSIDTNVLCSATNGETEPIQVNIFTSESSSQPQPTVSVDSTLVLSSTQLTATGSYESTDLTSPPQLYVLPSTAPQILRGAVANVKKTPQKNKEHRKENVGAKSDDSGSDLKEIYVDIAVNPVKTVTSQNKQKIPSVDLNTSPSDQHPLDKLCQLLCIDEDETFEKRMCESEKRRKHEETLQYKYFCDQCSFKAKRENHLLKHAKLHEKIKDLLCCDQCDFKTIRESVLGRHKMNHSATQLLCKLCPYKTDSSSFMLKHLQARHSPKVQKKLKCNSCEYIASTPRELQKHQKLLHKPEDQPKFWKCSKCPYKSKLRAHLTRHENDAHGSLRQFLCHYCGKSFKRNDTLTQHKVIHGEVNKTFTCQHCGKICTSSVFLREHLASHTTERPFLCDMCGSSFKTRGATQRHKRVMHSTSVPMFPCTQCERTFKAKTDLNRHRKTHRLKTEATIVPGVISGANVQEDVISTPITIQVVYTHQLESNNPDGTNK